MLTRKYLWQTHLGLTVSIEGIEDEHLANTIQFATFYRLKTSLIIALKQEAERRGLTKEYLTRAPFPYKDGVGNWIIWDYENNKPRVIGSYLRG